jgi:hypothetical protein
MLLVNPTEYVLFDLNIHPYTVPTLEYIKSLLIFEILFKPLQFIQDHPNGIRLTCVTWMAVIHTMCFQ